MYKSFLILATLLFSVSPASSRAAQQAGTASPAAGAQAASGASGQGNPVHPTAASLARAKDIYSFDCALCHGADGSGKSDLTTDVKLKDYRDPSSLQGLSDAEIFAIIDKGKGTMPPEHGRAKPDEIWNLVIYLRSFSKGQPATASQPSTTPVSATPAQN
jgi:mono/diheme cytochrome c family protein